MKKFGEAILTMACVSATVVGLAGCAPVMHTYNKPGVPPDQYMADSNICFGITPADAPSYKPVNPSGSTAGAVAGAVASGAVNSYKQGVRVQDVTNCMTAKGYRWITMTSAQNSALRGMTLDQRKDFMSRIASAAAPETVAP